MSDHAFLAEHGLFTARTPRYTSYPPAPHFAPGIGPETVAGWLRTLPRTEPVSVYAHIPFCRRLCWFCACRTQGTKTDAPLAPYVESLEAEADLLAAHLPPGLEAAHLHLGGGTPTILSPHLLDRVFAAITDRIPLTAGAEVSVEVDPTVLDDVRLDALARAGVTRASIGVQDFDPRVQAAIGRPQSLAETAFAVDGLRARGVSRVNMDLLYGLPFQTPASLSRTLDLVLDMAPDRIALFGYAHVPWASKRQVMIPEDALPDGPARLDLFDLAAGRLIEAGFVRLGIDHFARPDDPLALAARDGRMRRNFQGYTDDSAPSMIGLGASSIWKLPQGYVQNATGTADWARRVARGQLPVVRGHALSEDDRMRGALIEGLLCDFAAHPRLAGAHAAAAMTILDDLLARWPGAMVPDGTGGIAVTDWARPLVRQMAMDLDAYARPEGRHSIAV
nr:oxygen-independent coproporphyrinogen III oxidase [Jannaschia pohangensis]